MAEIYQAIIGVMADIGAIGKDKKNEDGMLRIVLPVGIGDCEVRPMTMDAFAALF